MCFRNLRLAALPTSVSYGDLSRLSLAGYSQSIVDFINSATKIVVVRNFSFYLPCQA
jgi:hypothetical protein